MSTIEVPVTESNMPTPTNIGVTATLTPQIVTQRQEDKFLFVEIWLNVSGIGKVPSGGLIDRPSYFFDSETHELDYRRNHTEPLLNSPDLGFVGQGINFERTFGGGTASGITIIKKFPINFELKVATGNLDERGSVEFIYIPVLLSSVLSDGTLIIEVNNEKVALFPNQSWTVTKEIVFSSEEYDGTVISTSAITNYGWLSIDLINP